MTEELLQERFSRQSMVRGYVGNDRGQRADAQLFMVRDSDVMLRSLARQPDMAAGCLLTL